MEIKSLRLKRMLQSVLIILLLGVAGLTNLNAQNFTVGDLNYSVNSNGTTVTVAGHVNGTAATGTLVIPESVTYQGSSYAVTEIGYAAFYNCSGFVGSLNIPNQVTTIGDHAFRGCSGFTNGLTIGGSVTTIGYSAFYNCSGFTGSLTIPNSVTTISDYAFGSCSGFNGSITIGNSVTTIGVSAFANCANITSIHFNASHCESMGLFGNEYYYVFYNNTSLNEIIIGDNVTSIPAYAFANHNSQNCHLTLGNAVNTIECGAFYNGDLNNPGFVGSLILPNSVTIIGDRAFRGCSGFTGSLNIPDSVTEIGDLAFLACEGFTGSLTIGNSVTSIGENAFGFCFNFSGSLVIPNSVTTIEVRAFSGCEGFTGNLIIPNSVTSIGDGAFYGCKGFTGNMILPNSVTNMGWNPFADCSGLEHISVDSGNLHFDSRGDCDAIIKTIDNELISGCKNTIIPNSVTSIGGRAFIGCVMDAITIPTSVTSIGFWSFGYCDNLTSITIPNSVISIGTNPFVHCFGLNSIYVDPGNTVYDSRGNCNAIIKTDSNELISGCKNTIIPYTVTSIGVDAFYLCSVLNAITIPSTVTSIGIGAFGGCTGLTTLTVLAETPPSLYNSNVFSEVPKNIPVYVPRGTIEAYRNASGWDEFSSYFETDNNCEITAIPNPFEGGSIIGLGTYSYGEEVTLKVIPNTFYVFENWTENNEIISYDETYSFLATRSRNLVAKLRFNEGVSEQNDIIVSVSPNPVHDKLFVNASQPVSTIEIFTTAGTLVYKQSNDSNTMEIDVHNLSSGIYFLRLVVDHKINTLRFVIE